MKVKLTSAQMNALRYAGRGELHGDPAEEVWADGRNRPVTEAARRLVEYGLITKSRPPGACRLRLVPTAEGALVLARDAQ